MDRRELVDVALGRRPADLVVRGGRLVNVLTREIYPADVAVGGRWIAAVGDVGRTVGPETQVVDAEGKYVTPGLIDQHIHIHETQLNVVEFAAAVLPRGTTGVCTDFYGEMVVAGAKAVRACLDAAQSLPLKVWFMLGTPGYYQNLPFGHSGWPTREEVLEMVGWPECCGMDDAFASKIVAADPGMLELIDMVQRQGKRVCGHGSEIRGAAVDAWLAYVRATDDHESVGPDEAVEKARAGIRISMREGSGCSNVASVVRAVTEHGVDPRRFCFSTDLISPLDIVDKGHIDNAMRTAVRAGLPPIVAVQMATLNAAECLHVDDEWGSLSPGKRADILLVDDLAEFEVATVIAGGQVVARDGVMSAVLPAAAFPKWAYGTVRTPRQVRADDFVLASPGAARERLVRVIDASGTTLVTGEAHLPMRVSHGRIAADPSRDVAKIAALERVRGTGEIGVGLIRGFGLRRGAIATTYNSQQQNLVVLGIDESDMAVAVNALVQSGGGFVVVADGAVKALLALPLFGLESDQPLAPVVRQMRELYEAARALGCALPAPFHTLGFMGLPVDIGTLKISPQGLVDVWKGEVVQLEV